MLKKLTTILLVLIFSFSLVSVGANSVQAADDTIDFGYVQWPGVTVKTEVAKKVIDYLGYETSMTSGSQAIVFKGMDTGDLDVFLGNWMPTMKMHFDKYDEKGTIKNVRVNLLDVVYKTAVPTYVWEAGVKSFEDLNEHADKFNSTVYGIEPGNEGNLIIQKAIDNDTYNLGDWKLQASSTAGMLTSAKRAINQEEWIAFNAWKPHYMNVMFDIKYLEDPEGIWGSGERVLTVVRTGFEEENSNVYKFFEEFKVTAPMQNKWIDMYKRQEMDPEEVAEQWIANNPEVVYQWVYGMESKDGRMARKVIAEKINN